LPGSDSRLNIFSIGFQNSSISVQATAVRKIRTIFSVDFSVINCGLRKIAVCSVPLSSSAIDAFWLHFLFNIVWWNNCDLSKFCYAITLNTAICQHWLMSEATNLVWLNCTFGSRKRININTRENVIILVMVKIGVRTK